MESSTNDKEYLTFKVNNVKFAVDSLHVDSIQNIDKITGIAGNNKAVDGIIPYKDTVIVVVNLNDELFNIKDHKESPICIVYKSCDKYIALRVSEIGNIIRVDNKNLVETDSITERLSEYVNGFIHYDNELIQTLNVNNIIEKH